MKLAVAVTLSLLSVLPVRAQRVDPIAGVPFTATWTMTSDVTSGGQPILLKAARASDGNTYFARIEGGNVVQAGFFDLSKKRNFHLTPADKSYVLFQRPDLAAETPAAYQAFLDRVEHPGQTQGKAGTVKTIPLGTMVKDGLTLYGYRKVSTGDDGSNVESEIWLAEQGFAVKMTLAKAGKPIYTLQLQEVTFREPDASLFLVPNGYSQAPSPVKVLCEEGPQGCISGPAATGVPKLPGLSSKSFPFEDFDRSLMTTGDPIHPSTIP